MSEKLECMRFDAERTELIVQLSGGGCADQFPPGLSVRHLANRLRDLAARLEYGVAQREHKAKLEAAYSGPEAGIANEAIQRLGSLAGDGNG